MRIISWNVNGLRSVYKKDFLGSLKQINADILCLQEIKIDQSQLVGKLANLQGYNCFYNCAQRKGYSGVAIYSKQPAKVTKVILGIDRFDSEGRILQIEYPQFTLINIYLPHGGREKENLGYKLRCYEVLLKLLKSKKGKKIVLVGDFNIAYEEIDLARPKQNTQNIMFTPQERVQLDQLIHIGFMDTFREFNKSGGNYSWWPYRFSARVRNLGWRIDYMFVSKALQNELQDAFILSDIVGSDHCPVGIDLK